MVKKIFHGLYPKKKIIYKKGLCPVAENLNNKNILTLEVCLFNLDKKDLDLICKSFEKVWKNLDSLKKLKNSKKLR